MMTNIVARVSRRTVWASHFLGPPSCCHFFPSSSSSFAAPSSLSFTASSSSSVFAGHLHQLEISVGVEWEDGQRKRTTTSIVVRFWDALHVPPSPWVSPHVSPPQFPSSSKNRPAHIPVERRGAAAAESSLLRELEGCWLSPHPSIEGRGGARGQVVSCGWGRIAVVKAKMVGRKDRG
jgi:hypothetical protein